MRRTRRIITNNVKNTRQTLSRLWRDYYYQEEPDMDISELRAYIDMAKAIIGAHKTEAELRVSEELAEIREKLKDKGII